MYKKLMLFFLSLVSFCLLAPISSAFAADQVQVSLPSFTVTLNGQTTGNDYSKYPLIVYKNITYFPMTYYDCRLLGLKTDWTNDTGLIIEKNEDYFYEYMREVNDNKNASKQIAKIAADKITVNGNVIDNSTEEYPLLVFRDVTYFPLTWRFAVNEFGCNYTFDQKNGLVIQNDNVKLENPYQEKWDRILYSEGHLGRGNNVRFHLSEPSYNNCSMENMEAKTIYLHYMNYLSDPSRLEISNMGDVTSFIDARMEYQIYKQISNHEELVCRYLLPPLNGKIGWAGLAYYNIDTSFWLTPELTTGKYKISLQYPDYFNCYRSDNKTPSKLILRGPSSEVSFAETDFYIKVVD